MLCAADAEPDLTLARADLPDLGLMGVQLPGMDGVAATALITGQETDHVVAMAVLTISRLLATPQSS